LKAQKRVCSEEVLALLRADKKTAQDVQQQSKNVRKAQKTVDWCREGWCLTVAVRGGV
jgi:hypothetical protein